MVKFISDRTDIQNETERAKEFLSNSNGEYNSDDVLKALNAIFYGKCYICENSHPIMYNIEHLIPHKGNSELKTDWNNLFLSCGHCNNIKSAKYDNILDCTQIHPDKSISFQYNSDIYNPDAQSVTVKPLNQENSTLSTVNLLNAVYYGNTPEKRLSANNIKWLLHEEMTKFKSALQSYKRHLENNDTMAMEDDIYLLKQSLNCSSSFTAFKRWYIMDNKEDYSILYDYLINQVYI